MRLLGPGTRLRQLATRLRSFRGGSSAFSPADLPGLVLGVNIALMRSSGLLWQNTGKTVPAVEDGDPIRVAVCPWTAVELTAPSDSARPLLWDEGSGLWSAMFDGVDDLLETATAPSWTGTDGSLAARFAFTDTTSSLAACTTEIAGNDNEYYNFTGDNLAYARCFRTIRHGAYASLTLNTTPHTQIWVSGADYRVYLDTVQQGSAVATAWAAPSTMKIGQGDIGIFFPGRFAGLVLAAAAWDELTRAQVDAYLAALLPS